MATGLVLQILEGMLPPVLPLPGVKLGLANLATLVALFTLGPWEAVGVNLLRCLLGGLLRGSLVGLTISLAAGTAATLVMVALYAFRPPGVTLTGMSIAGAVSHNSAQLGVAVWLVGFSGLRHYLPFLLVLAVPTGFLVGVLARRLLLSLGAAPRTPEAFLSRPGLTAPPGHRPDPGLPRGRTAFPEVSVTRRPAGMAEGAAVLMEEVTVRFPGRENRPALADLSLRVGEGEFLAITGLNGSGKSTLCRLVNGLLIPARGRVLVHGLDTSVPEELSLIRREVALLMQNPDHQLVASTVEEDVAFGPENLGLSPGEVRERVEEALRTANITGLRRRQPHLLSMGEKKLVALAGALAVRPRILLADEFTSMLDPAARKGMMGLLLRLKEKAGITLLYVTHRPEEFILADRLILLEEGRLVYDGPPLDFLEDSNLRKRTASHLPETISLARELARRGWAVPERPRDVEELVEAVWASL